MKLKILVGSDRKIGLFTLQFLIDDLIVYFGSRIYSPEEEKILSKIFNSTWDEYCRKVKFPWL
jgi:protein-S-isoprenylcysteine O-methyltransferase Ste14